MEDSTLLAYIRYSPRPANGPLVARQVKKLFKLFFPRRPRFYVDADKRGCADGMPQFLDLISALGESTKPVVAVERTFRLGRDRQLLLKFLKRLREANGELWVCHGVNWLRDEARLPVRVWGTKAIEAFVQEQLMDHEQMSEELRTVARGAQERGLAWGRPPAQLTDDDVAAMADLAAAKMRRSEIAKRFGVSVSTVGRRLKNFREQSGD